MNFFKVLRKNWRLILKFGWKDAIIEYIGSSLGVIWEFIRPLSQILIFWFIFGYVFKQQPIDDVPFVVWLVSGQSIWFFLSDAINSASTAITSKAGILKQTPFAVEIIPIINVVKFLYKHFIVLLIFSAIIISLNFFEPVNINFNIFLLLFYLFGAIMLIVAVSILLAIFNVFLKDINFFVGVLMNIMFWMTPITWNVTNLSPSVISILKLNPFYYLVNGYRDAIINGFNSQTVLYHSYFWSLTIILFLFALYALKKLKVEVLDNI